MNSLSTLPAFLAYFTMAIGLVAIFLAVYTALTPHKEWGLIRDGNAAAALSLSGAAIGFCLPLASVIAHSVGVLDMLVWAVVALVVQLLFFVAVYGLRREVCEAIVRGEMASAVTLAAGSVGIGVLNAACVSY